MKKSLEEIICNEFVIDTMQWLYVLVLCLVSLSLPLTHVAFASNANLFVSAENSMFSNHFSGPMVIEVVIRDPDIHDTDQGKGEPDVTINGKQLRMVQASDGNWYAYFANVDKAKIADQTVLSSTDSGVGLDFGVFCSRDTSSSVLGVSFSDSDGVAVPRTSSLSGYTNGDTSFSSCNGSMNSSTSMLNNVVKKPRAINTNSNIPTGQIGLVQNAWPIIQLFSFNDVTILYNAAGGTQRVDLKYDPIPNISLTLDRDIYSPNSQVHTTIKDFQLNIDPTDNDSWTFNVVSPLATFYQAYDNNGQSSANSRNGLVNLVSSLSNLGFEKNGKLSMTLNSVVKLTTNNNQPNTSVTNPSTGTYSNIVTFVESQPNSGVFESFDYNDQSTIKLDDNAPRGQSGTIEYNQESHSIVSGYSGASVIINNKPVLSFGSDTKNLVPGTKTPILLTDPDQNLNSGVREDLDVFRDTAIIPTLKIGSPITLQSASGVKFFADSGSSTSVASSVPDKVSSRLFIKSKDVSSTVDFEKISIDLGVSADTLKSSLIDTTISTNNGTNWVNYDLRSIQRDLGVSDFSDTSVSLSFNGANTITLIPKGSLSTQGLYQISESTVHSIFSKSGSITMTIDFDSSSNNVNVGKIQSETSSQPVVFDFFAFGKKGNTDVNNAIYRFELEETEQNSSVFTGTIEPMVVNQLNQFDPDFIKTITPIDSQVKFIVIDRQIDEKGITITYSDVAQVGATIASSLKSDVSTNSGIVSLGSSSYRFGQPVTLTLRDPDLNLHHDLIDIYNVINDPNSKYVDTVGANGQILLEVLIKDIRYKRCTISGQEYGGLASTGFSLVETGPSTGIFEGTFKMPSQICDKSGTKLISPAGGIVDAKYYDAHDQSGSSNIFTASRSTANYSSNVLVSEHDVALPNFGETTSITLSGTVGNSISGVPLTIQVISPNGIKQTFTSSLTNTGNFKGVINVNEKSFVGKYDVILVYNGKTINTTSFVIHSKPIPQWFKTSAQKWNSEDSSSSDFAQTIRQMITEKAISPPEKINSGEEKIPLWIKNNIKWWQQGLISDDDFISTIQYLIKKGIILV